MRAADIPLSTFPAEVISSFAYLRASSMRKPEATLCDGLRDGLLPFALSFQDQLDDFARGAFASGYGGDVMRGAFHFDDGVGDGDC